MGFEHFEQGQEQSPGESMKESAADFSRDVQEASDRLSEAAQALADSLSRAVSTVFERLDHASQRQEQLAEAAGQAVEEARGAAGTAQAAASSVADAERRVQQIAARLEGDRGTLSQLIDDLRNRIGALSILVAPLPHQEPPSPPPEQPEPLQEWQHESPH